MEMLAHRLWISCVHGLERFFTSQSSNSLRVGMSFGAEAFEGMISSSRIVPVMDLVLSKDFDFFDNYAVFQPQYNKLHRFIN